MRLYKLEVEFLYFMKLPISKSSRCEEELSTKKKEFLRILSVVD